MTKKTRLITIKLDGSQETVEINKADLLKTLYQLIDTDCVTRTEVRWEGKKRYIWLSDNGFAEGKLLNPYIRPLAEDYWKRPCQDFVGVGVVEVPVS